jgi:serine/threonine protein kinase/tetratricopeptide (TPR) repeat protein
VSPLSEEELAETDLLDPLDALLEKIAQPPPPSSFARGHVIGAYRLLSTLGAGGMAVVYRAEHVATGQPVALKTVRIPDGSRLGSIRREIQALSQLHHPGVVRILDEGLHEGLPWYAMELLAGRSLRQWLREVHGEVAAPTAIGSYLHSLDVLGATGSPAGPSNPNGTPASSLEQVSRILTVARRLCEPLAFLHGEGIVHRDLKPENIVVGPGDAPVIVDFGLATDAGGGRETLAVESGISGSAPYMSPEQIDGRPLDVRSDLYALGIILYELLTGRRPFAGPSLSLLFEAHRTQAPPRPSALAPAIPMGVELLVDRLLAKDRRDRPGYAQDVAAALVTFGAQPAEAATKHRPYLYRPSFSGRDELVETLQRLLARCDAAAGRLVLLEGESGVGKTRLAVELARYAASRAHVVFAGGCQDAVVRLPLCAMRAPLLAIADRCRERGASEVERVLGPRGKLLAAYEPALSQLPGLETLPEPAELPADMARLRLFAALEEILTAVIGQKPAVILLDDLQWADELSLGFLEFLAERGVPLHALIIGTYRAEEVGDKLDRLRAHAAVHRLQVGRLFEDAVAEMIGAMLSLEQPPIHLSHFLARQSEGNPFFVAEYLRAAVEEDLLRRDTAGHWQVAAGTDYEQLGLPRSLRTLVSRRLAGLSPAARAQLDAAAILGREFTQDLLFAMAQDGAVALGELLRKQIVEESARSVLRFAHDKLREGVLAEIAPDGRPALHRAAAQAMEALGLGDASAAELGHHWDQAGDSGRAKPCYLRAARDAARTYSLQTAEKLYLAYLRLVERPDSESATVRNELGARVLEVQGRLEEAALQHAQAAGEARACGACSVEVDALRLRGLALSGLARAEEADGEFAAALALATHLGDGRLEGICLRSLAKVYRDRGQHEQAIARLERALALARASNDRHEEAICLGFFAWVQQQQGRMEDSKRLHEQALPLLHELGDRRQEALQLGRFANMFHNYGRLAEARPLYERSLAILREVGDRRGEGLYLGNLADLYHDLGDNETSKRLCAEAISLLREVGDIHIRSLWMGNLAAVHREEGRIEESRVLFEQAQVLAHQFGDRRIEGILLCERGRLELWSPAGPAAAERFFQESGALLVEVGEKLELAKVWCGRGHLRLALGESAEAELAQARALMVEVDAGAASDVGNRLAQLERAQVAYGAGRGLRGYDADDLPEPVRHELMGTEGTRP